MTKDRIYFLKCKLPHHILPVFLLWLEGFTAVEMKEFLGHGRRTNAADAKFYRSSKFLRDNHGLDVRVRRAGFHKKKVSNVVRLVRTVEAVPDQPPQWMRDKGLIHEPSDRLLKVVK